MAVDLGIDAAKTGMLASAEVVESVCETVAELGVGPLVVDPVLVSKHGDRLLAPDAVAAVRDILLPLATVVTPNLPEAEALVGFPVTDRDGMVAAARALLELGPDVVLVKGGHLGGDTSPDCLLVAGAADPVWLEGPGSPAGTPTARGACCRRRSAPSWPGGWSRPTPAWRPSGSWRRQSPRASTSAREWAQSTLDGGNGPATCRLTEQEGRKWRPFRTLASRRLWQ